MSKPVSEKLRQSGSPTHRLTHSRSLLLFLVLTYSLTGLLTHSAGASQFTAQWFFSESPFSAPAVRKVDFTPLWTVTASGTNILIGTQRYPKQTTNGSLTISNIFSGGYRVEYAGQFTPVIFTNVFPSSITDGALVNAKDYISASLAVNGTTTAYSQAASDLRYLRTNITQYVIPGANVTGVTNGNTLTLSASASEGGSSDSITNFDARSIVLANRLTLTNTAAAGGTNQIDGTLNIGKFHHFPTTDGKMTINSSVTNQVRNYTSQLETRAMYAYTTNVPSAWSVGISAFAQLSEGNTADWAMQGYPNLSAINATVGVSSGGGGRISRTAAVSATASGCSAGTNCTVIDEATIFWGDTSGDSISHLVGLKLSGMVQSATNNTCIWAGQFQQDHAPDGNWFLYDLTAFPSLLSGNLIVVGTNIGNGQLLTNLNASSLANGTIGDARLSGNVALLDREIQPFAGGTNSFTGRLAVGSAGSTNKLDVVAGTLATNSKAFNVTGTLANSASTETGAGVTITGAGSGANVQNGFFSTLAAGYTGSGTTIASRGLNSSAGTGVAAWTGAGANLGGFAQGAGTTAGHNVGLNGTASGSSSLNLGMFGRAVVANNSAALNVGVAGHALNASTANVGGFFGLLATAPTLGSSAALIADNGAEAAPIFIARDNGGEVFRIDDGGIIYGQADGLTNLNGSAISTGTVAPARLGSGSSISSKFLRGDSTWQTIAGGGDLLAANNLTDLASVSAGRTNLAAHDASNLTIGTIPDARLSGNVITNFETQAIVLTNAANQFAGSFTTTAGVSGQFAVFDTNKKVVASLDGSALTSLTAANLTGTVTDARLSGNVITNYETQAVSLTNAGNAFVGSYGAATNALNTGTYVAGQTYFTNLSGNITLGVLASIPTGAWSITIAAKNASGTDRTVTMPNGVVDNANGVSPGVVYCTNGQTVVFQIVGYGSSFTNLTSPH